MILLRTRLQHRDEQGVAIVLALAFIVLVGVITTALLASLTSAVNERSTLDSIRNRQYAADAAVEKAIARVRVGPGAPGFAPCSAPTLPEDYALNGYTIRVECTIVPILTLGRDLQGNVVFTTCVENGSHCGASNTIIRAQVNFENADIETPNVTKTYVQSWTVTR